MTTTPQPRPVLVTGPTGKIGRRVVARLEGDGRRVRAASRSSETRLDWADPGTWPAAFAGVGPVFLLPPEVAVDVEPLADVLAAADLERVVLLSARHPEQGGDGFVPSFETAVEESGVPAVVLRPSWFVQNFTEGMFAPDLAGGSLTLPVGEGLEPFIDVADIADVAVAALTSSAHDGRTYELSGPELLTFAQAVDRVGAATSRELRFVPASVEEWAAAAADELPPSAVELMVNLYSAIRRGDNGHLSTGVQEALGRTPRTIEQALVG